MTDKPVPFYATWWDVVLPVELWRPLRYLFSAARDAIWPFVSGTRIGKALYASGVALFVMFKLSLWTLLGVFMLLVGIPLLVLSLRWMLFVGGAALAVLMRVAMIMRSAAAQTEGVVDLLASDFASVGPEVCGDWSTLWCNVFPGCCALQT